MTQAVDLTLTNVDPNSHLTAAVLTPSAGDRVPAQWRVNSESSKNPMQRISVQMSSRFNTKRNARNVELKLVRPVVLLNAASGKLETQAQFLGSATFIIPLNADSAQVDDAVANFGSLFWNASILAAIKNGYAPT